LKRISTLNSRERGERKRKVKLAGFLEERGDTKQKEEGKDKGWGEKGQGMPHPPNRKLSCDP